MSAPIGDQLAAEYTHHGIAQDIDHIKHIWQHIRHTETSPVGQPAKGTTTMNIADFEQDIRNDVQAGMDKAADLYNHLKTVVEQKLPQVAAIQQSPVAQAVEGIILPPEIEAELTSIAKTYAARFGAPASAPAAPAEPEPDPAPAQ